MGQLLSTIKHYFSDRFSLSDDKEDETLIIESIRKGVHFKGTNVWTLIFAIIIASIGLNVNSTAVIIGAMLISPLMGPIMGIGLSMGISDFDLLKKSTKNLLVATIISLITSFLYFTITPLREASSELLARTTPSVWDVFIAFFGGLAGIVAGTRKEKSNVIPGVAIATALMPPLCTAGYGLATGKLFYFLGALYLFFINSLFICLATFLIVKHLRFHKVEFTTPEREKRVTRYMLLIVVLTIIPSIYLAYRITERSIFERNAKRFVQTEFHFRRTQVVTHNYVFEGDKRLIELLLFGQPLSIGRLDTIKTFLPKYNLANTELIVHQGFDAKQQIDLSAIKASILEDVFRIDTLDNTENTSNVFPDLKDELKALYPHIESYTLQNAVIKNVASLKNDTVTLFTAKFQKQIKADDERRLTSWLKLRVKSDSIKVVIEIH